MPAIHGACVPPSAGRTRAVLCPHRGEEGLHEARRLPLLQVDARLVGDPLREVALDADSRPRHVRHIRPGKPIEGPLVAKARARGKARAGRHVEVEREQVEAWLPCQGKLQVQGGKRTAYERALEEGACRTGGVAQERRTAPLGSKVGVQAVEQLCSRGSPHGATSLLRIESHARL